MNDNTTGTTNLEAMIMNELNRDQIYVNTKDNGMNEHTKLASDSDIGELKISYSDDDNINTQLYNSNSNSIFDSDYSNTIEIEELNEFTDKDQTKMIKKQKEFEKYSKCACGYKFFRTIWLFKTIIFNIMFTLTGLGISNFVKNILLNDTLSYRIWFYTIYFCLFLFCIDISKLLLILIMKILRKLIKNSWKVFYIKGIHKRLYMTLLSILWFVTFCTFSAIVKYDYNKNILACIQCITLSSIVFLCSHYFIRYIALKSYFGIFKQRARKIKAYNMFIEIMLNKTCSSLFCLPIMNFLIDFPSNDDINDAEKNLDKNISFKFNIIPTENDKHKMKEMFNYNESITNEMETLLSSTIYSINLCKSENSTKLYTLIKEQMLDKLTRVISYLIMVRLNETKNKVIKSPKSKLKSQTLYSLNKLDLLSVNNNNKITKDIFIKIFESYPKPNKKLLIDLGELAWKKFKDKDSGFLNVNVLNMNLKQIINDLLQLKSSIDAYIVIINNLQQTMDIITPILLLFVYLYIFNFSFQETVTLYVSSVGIIGFFGSSYFSSVFASISFILTLNPFLVGDYIMYNDTVYKVEEIALISCVFRQMKNGYSYSFQNKQLGQSTHPIVNYSRSNKLKYKWIFYFKPYDMKYEQIYVFSENIKEKIKQIRNYELKNIKNSYLTYCELKNINYNSVKAKAFDLDIYGRKKVRVQMSYEEYCSDVQSLCFNCITQVIKEMGFDCDPIQHA